MTEKLLTGTLSLNTTNQPFQENVSSIWASEYVSKQPDVADIQGLGKQEKHKKS